MGKSVKITIEVSEEAIASALVSALEGGTNYWLEILEYGKPKKLTYRCDKQKIFKHIDYPMNSTGSIVLRDTQTGKDYRLTRQKLNKAVKLMAEQYSQAFSDMINESGDAITGDMLVQLAVFGDVIYG